MAAIWRPSWKSDRTVLAFFDLQVTLMLPTKFRVNWLSGLVKFVGCKRALNPAAVYCTDRSKAMVPVLGLLFDALWFILRGELF